MNYTDYRKFTKLIDSFLETGNRKTLKTIQDMIEKKSGCRERLLEDIVENHMEYIKVFSTEEQIKIVNNFVLLIEPIECLAYNITCILPYVSNEALKEILSTIDDYALLKIIHEIKQNIKYVEHRYWDSSIFSKMKEKIKWYIIYIKCRRNLKL